MTVSKTCTHGFAFYLDYSTHRRISTGIPTSLEGGGDNGDALSDEMLHFRVENGLALSERKKGNNDLRLTIRLSISLLHTLTS